MSSTRGLNETAECRLTREREAHLVPPLHFPERPIREYEIVSEIAEARATPEDYFILKRTELAPYLSIRSVPSISPTLAGWAYIQESKGKWAKRWLELRDHQLFHAKNEKVSLN